MARLINRPVDVVVGPKGVPHSFRSGGIQHQVREVLESWLETGRWWEQESEVATYRVSTTTGGIYELIWVPRQKLWYLYKAYD